MFVRLRSAAWQGFKTAAIGIEVDCSSGLPGFSMVGLPDGAVRESKERVVAALRESGYKAMNMRTTVNFSPADVRKEGSMHDLGLAIALLLASKQIEVESPERYLIMGELGLDGGVRSVRGVLSVAATLEQLGGGILVVPRDNLQEALSVEGIRVVGVASLGECIALLCNGCLNVEPSSHSLGSLVQDEYALSDAPDFADVVGLASVRRALEIAVAGAHNFLMVGPPGSGKSLCARCIPSIQPPLLQQEALEITRIHSCAGLLPAGAGLLWRRPFRAPHHSSSAAALVGGGRLLLPGEASMAHNGLLFLDELPEFSRDALQVLRQPLEEGSITLNRVGGSIEWPANFLLGAAMNPCPCGHSFDQRRTCTCSAEQARKYRARIAGPLLDRIDIQVWVPPAPMNINSDSQPGEPSRTMRARVVSARKLQWSRQGKANAHLGSMELRSKVNVGFEAETFLTTAVERMGLSARAWHRVLRVATTIADLRKTGQIHPSKLADTTDWPQLTVADLAEALQYRSMESEW